jgi:aryl-alcohol dehydrogenase-like predicted oxidoreductase
MKSRKLGASDLDVPVIGLGCMVMPGFYTPGRGIQRGKWR